MWTSLIKITSPHHHHRRRRRSELSIFLSSLLLTQGAENKNKGKKHTRPCNFFPIPQLISIRLFLNDETH